MFWRAQNGNVLFLLLIVIALFGALSYTVSGMLQGSGPDVSGEKAGLNSNQLLDFGRAMRQTVQDLRISEGCADTEISFENPVVSGYTNGTNTDCQIFAPDGGGMSWSSPAPELNEGAEWLYTGNNAVDGVGTSAPDLVLILRDVRIAICNAVNEDLGIASAGGDTTIDFTQFTGTYTTAQTLDDADGKMAGCLNFSSSGDNFFYYQVLIAR